MNEEFFAAIELMAAEKHIPVDLLYEKVRNALIVAEKRNFGGKDDVVFCDIDPEAKTLRVYARKTVVEELEDPDTEILVDAAHQYDANAKAGDIIEIPLDTKKFGRIDAQKAKHSIRQGIRDAEHSLTLDVFSAHKQENISVKVLNVDTRNGNAIVEIQDHGCGMTEEAQQRIFDKFYQADKSRRQEGVGLGLSLVKRIVDMMGGTISVQSSVGEGATFRVELPVSPPRHHHIEHHSSDQHLEALNG
jgi:light-regulated signal transduction histidine kinase (bacteriophytochrome)